MKFAEEGSKYHPVEPNDLKKMRVITNVGADVKKSRIVEISPHEMKHVEFIVPIIFPNPVRNKITSWMHRQIQ